MNRHGRRQRAPRWLVAILVIAWPAPACRGHDDRPVDVTLSTLARYQEAYQGRLVRTDGIVRTYESSGQYWIEDTEPNRVALEPVRLVAPLLGKEVRVVGRFHFDDRTGRLIHIEAIATPVPAPAPPPGGH